MAASSYSGAELFVVLEQSQESACVTTAGFNEFAAVELSPFPP